MGSVPIYVFLFKNVMVQNGDVQNILQDFFVHKNTVIQLNNLNCNNNNKRFPKKMSTVYGLVV